MSSIFNTLNIGYSGLSAAQVGIDTTGHNIANAEVDGYSRQRVVSSAAAPVSSSSGQIGNGTQILDIKRVFDNYTFDRYVDVSSDKEYSDYEKKTLETVSTYFPEIDGVGVKSDLANYYDMWQSLADNPDNTSIKVALAEQTNSLSSHIRESESQVKDLQLKVNDEIAMNVDEVNRLAKELANINKSIDTAESGDMYSANDLRDKRSLLEKDLAKLIGAKTTKDQLESNMQIDTNSNERTGSYTVEVNGFNIVDGSTFHPLTLTNDNPDGFYELSYERQDGVKIPMTEKITGGKVGAMLDLRGHSINSKTGTPSDGILQNTLDGLNAFAKGLIEATNNLYAESATTRADSNVLDLNTDTPLVNSNYNIKEGSFSLIVYDLDGNEVAMREINIDATTSMDAIKNQVDANIDDNEDSDGTNDIDDYLNFDFTKSGTIASFSMDPSLKSQGYTFAIKDNLTNDDFDSGSNFAGAFGFNRFFDGENAHDIRLNYSLNNNPDDISAGTSSASGDNDIALNMVQQQYEEYSFDVNSSKYNASMYGMFDIVVTDVGTKTNSAIMRNDTLTAQYNATEMEYFSTTKVNVDEEMTNLIKYQTAYSASAKVITTIDQMLQTLLGMKQ